MRRAALLTAAALGAAVTLLGEVGLFAALSDTARTGSNTVQTAALPRAADVQLASGSSGAGGVGCGEFAEDLTTGLISIIDVPPGHDTGAGYYFCLRNVGSKSLTLVTTVTELLDKDLGCSGDEASFEPTGPPGCAPDAEGELSAFVTASFFPQACTGGPEDQGPTHFGRLADLVPTPAALGALAPGQTRCFLTSIFQSAATPDQRQAAQTDRLTWRYAFTGTA